MQSQPSYPPFSVVLTQGAKTHHSVTCHNVKCASELPFSHPPDTYWQVICAQMTMAQFLHVSISVSSCQLGQIRSTRQMSFYTHNRSYIHQFNLRTIQFGWFTLVISKQGPFYCEPSPVPCRQSLFHMRQNHRNCQDKMAALLALERLKCQKLQYHSMAALFLEQIPTHSTNCSHI